MKAFGLLGAACTFVFAAAAPSQVIQDGNMFFLVVDSHWVMQECYFLPETNDPIGLIGPNNWASVNTFSTSDGDFCSADGAAHDSTVGGARMLQTATSIGLHYCSWGHSGNTGEVEMQSTAFVEGSVTLTNGPTAAAALGFAEVTSNISPTALAVLTDSAAESAPGLLGNVSGAYDGISGYAANVQLGTGTFADNDYAELDVVVCTNLFWVQHRSRSFARVLAAFVAGGVGTSVATADMSGECFTGAVLLHCPDQ